MKNLIAFLLSFLIISSMIFTNLISEEQSKSIIFKEYNTEYDAIQSVKVGGDKNGSDIFLNPISIENLDIINDKNIGYVVNKRGSIISLLINPAPYKMNPFKFKEIRYALNFAIDRSLIKKELLKNYADEIISPISYYMPEWIITYNLTENIKFDLNFANKIIENKLKNEGYIKENNTWKYNNITIELNFLININNNITKLISEEISNKLEKLGFKINKIYSNETKEIVYEQDPKELKWHVYVEEWSLGEIFRYSEYLISQFYAPWYGNMPGSLNPSFWNYENSTLDFLSKKILAGDYANKRERDEIFRKIVKIGIEEAVRLFIVEKHEIYIYNKFRVEGIINEYSNGINNVFNFLNLRLIRNKNEPITVAILKSVYEPFNPISGFKNIYQNLIFNLVKDNGIYRDPYSGKPFSFNIKYKVLYHSNKISLNVPNDAIFWNSKNNRWENVNNLKVTTAVNYEINYLNWHDGSKMNLYDILYWFYLLWEWSDKYNETDFKFSYEFYLKYGYLANSLKAIKINSDNNLTLYFNFNHFDEDEIASLIYPWSTLPWHLLFAMEYLNIEKFLVWFPEESKTFGKDIIDLINPDHALMIKKALEYFYNSSIIPDPLKNGKIIPISIEETKERYRSLINFIETNKHSLISNGSFILDLKNLKLILINPNDEIKIFEKEREIRILSLNYTNVIFNNEVLSISLNVTSNFNNSINIFYIIYDQNSKIYKTGFSLKNKIFEINEKITIGKGEITVFLYIYSEKTLIPLIKTLSVLVLESQTLPNTTTGNFTIISPPYQNLTTSPLNNTTILTTFTTELPSNENYYYIVIFILIIAIIIALYFGFIRRKY